MGIIAALVWGAVGYAVARTKGETFDTQKFSKTVLVGLILGVIATGAGVEVSTVEGYSLLQVVVIFVDKLTGLLSKPKS